ncbi:MAG: PHP domain-containing protein [Raoultibacter sp.]|jgi:predicted metal-dependent phosphoesterase TrpH
MIIKKEKSVQRATFSLRDFVECLSDPLSFDLHIHSTVSDGSDSFIDIIHQAKRLDISSIAFTNHDTVVGLDFAMGLGEDCGINVIGGVEISAHDPHTKKRIHVLGYGLTSNSPEVTELCRPVLARRTENTHWQMDRLIKEEFSVDVEKALGYAQVSTAFYKQHLMAGLTENPYGSESYRTLYENLFKGEGIVSRDIEYVTACDAVKAIIKDGGVPVLAHPGQLDSYEFVPQLVECGLRGIEKYHPDHNLLDVALCSKLQKRYGLIATGGSDYHGTFGSIPALGLKREFILASCKA